jgi:hypothetical protein
MNKNNTNQKSTQPISTRPEITVRKRAFGLIYGLLSGLAFAGAAWGYDACILSGTHVVFPWLKVITGGAACLLIGGCAGWLTARCENGIVAVILWILTAGLFALLTIAVPFLFAPKIMGWLDANLAGRLNYYIYEGFYSRMVIVFVWIAIMALIVGVVQLPTTEQAVFATSTASRLMPFILSIFIMSVAGTIGDNLIAEPLRSPTVTIDRLIQFAVDTSGVVVDKKLAREMHLGALGPIRDLIHRPRRLVVGGYSGTLEEIYVMVDFDGIWAECHTIYNQATICLQASP